MADISKISWCDATLNFWEGCTKISEGCAHCYAENRDVRFYGGAHWGKGAPRKKSLSAVQNCRRFSKKSNEGEFVTCLSCGARRWRSEVCCGSNAARLSRPIVFVMSLGDFLDEEVPVEWRAEALTEMLKANGCDFMILTKRPENYYRLFAQAALKMSPAMRSQVLSWIKGEIVPPNIALGATVESANVEGRLNSLALMPAARRFISAEPLLSGGWADRLKQFAPGTFHLVIAGGESLTQARPMHPRWARELEIACDHQGIAYHFKQWGEWAPIDIVPPDWTKPAGGNLLVVTPDGKVDAYDPDRSPESYGEGHRVFSRVGKTAGGNACDSSGRTRTEFLTFPTASWRHDWWSVGGRTFPARRFAQEFIQADPAERMRMTIAAVGKPAN